jgi:hypothetical protein
MPLDDSDRLATAAAFVARLFAISRRSPKAWRRADAVGRSAGIEGLRLEQALADAEQAGLLDRRVDDPGLVPLIGRGRGLAERQWRATEGGAAVMRYELRSWVRLIALCVGVLAVVTAAIVLSEPVGNLVALR